MPDLTRLDITLPGTHSEDEAELLQALLALHVSHGWEEESLSTGELRCRVHSVLPDVCGELARVVAAALPATRFEQSRVEDRDWMEAWKEFFTPVEAGSLFLVLAPWMEKERAATSRIPIIIEPKTAFGTGHHATTALCLEAIAALHDQKLVQAGMRFLDLGMGSGILGIACARLGMSGQGLDIESPAVANAEENRSINGIAEKDFAIALGSVEKADGPYDLILANILARPLKDLAPDIAALPGPGDRRPLLVLSGMLDIQADAVEQAYRALGYPEARRLSKGEWVALIFP